MTNSPATEPADIDPDYYSFDRYNSKMRMLTYWYQIQEILRRHPSSVLEVGIGSGMVTSYLRHCGIHVTTVDVNEGLNPDLVGSVLELSSVVRDRQFDTVVCCRVLHHLPCDLLEPAVTQLYNCCRSRLLLTLPVDDMRVYLSTRWTAARLQTLSIPLPRGVKPLLARVIGVSPGSGLWQVNSSRNTRLKTVLDRIERASGPLVAYQLPEDKSHLLVTVDRV
jgi:SAM-dependent methyltransferase